MSALKRREFLQLANKYEPSKRNYNLSGWYVSEKLDGQRCFWDAGITRGMKTVDVPWANIFDPKNTGQLKKKIKPVSTGLWSRYGNPIMAPDWFLNGLPSVLLDGELFAGRGNFQTAMSTVRKDNPVDDEWRNIQLAVFSSPSFESVFGDGEIKNSNFHRILEWSSISQWLKRTLTYSPLSEDLITTPCAASFDCELAQLQQSLAGITDFAYLHHQVKLPDNSEDAADMVERLLEKTLTLGGEGLIIRAPGETWQPKRLKHILKYKPHLDGEAKITGYTSGRQGKQGNLRGKIGALITDFKGKRLEVSGLTYLERAFESDEQSKFAYEHPGEDMPHSFSGKSFKPGDVITIKYRELSDTGVPKEARYFRRHSE